MAVRVAHSMSDDHVWYGGVMRELAAQVNDLASELVRLRVDLAVARQRLADEQEAHAITRDMLDALRRDE